jgi:hypothetical protein
MADSRGLRETWLRPFFFYGNNPSNPYVGIIFYLLLPGLFMLGLVLIAVGILLRRQHLKASGQIPSIFPNC